MEKIIYSLLLLISFFPKISYGKSSELDLSIKKNHESAPLERSVKYIDYVDKGYDFLTRKIYLLANTVDAIFTQRSIDESKNKSYLRFWYEFNKTEGDNYVMRPDFRLRVYLKETRKLLKFTFDNTSRTQDTQTQLSQTQAQANARNEDKSLAASVGINVKETRDFKLSSSAGVRLGVPPNLFFRSTGSYRKMLGSINFSLQNATFYYSLDGFGNTSNINFLYTLSNNTRLIFETFGTWLEPRDFNAGSGFQLFYTYNDFTSMNAQIGTNANKQESKFSLKNYFISYGIRRLLYKDWFFAEISPRISWERSNRWEPALNLYFRIEAFIGGNK